MLYYDQKIGRQLARERIDELAREYRRAQKGPARAHPLARTALLLARLRRERPERAPAYRA